MLIKTIKTLMLSMVVASTQFAFAYTIGPNQTANLGSTGLYYSLSGIGGDQAGVSYSVHFNTNGTMQSGNLNGNTLDSLAFNVLLSSAQVYKFVNGAAVAVAGNLSGEFNLNLGGVSLNQAANQAAALGGVSSGSGSISFSGTIDGQTVQLSTTSIGLNYMDFASGMHGGAYDSTVAAFGPGNVNFGLSLDGSTSSAHIWSNGTGSILFNGVASNFYVGGDLHSTLSIASNEVPEPATMGLLFSGLIGGAASRRRVARSV